MPSGKSGFSMKISSLILAITGIILTVSLLGILFYPSINDFMSSNKAWNGIHSFVKEFNAENMDSLADISPQAQQEVLVCIPYIEYSGEELFSIKEFTNHGNLLLILDDFGYGNQILEYLGIEARFSNMILLDPLFNYKNQFLPRITDFSAEITESGIEAITLNHASTLINVGQAHILARSSPTSFTDANNNGTLDDDEQEGPLVVAAEYDLGKGKILLVSDPSIMINTMVGQNNNYEFIDYLITLNDTPEKIYLDRAHISKTPLDVSKISMEKVKEFLNNRYVLLGMVAIIFVPVAAFALKKEDAFS
jgi:hypothetical protein